MKFKLGKKPKLQNGKLSASNFGMELWNSQEKLKKSKLKSEEMKKSGYSFCSNFVRTKNVCWERVKNQTLCLTTIQKPKVEFTVGGEEFNVTLLAFCTTNLIYFIFLFVLRILNFIFCSLSFMFHID